MNAKDVAQYFISKDEDGLLFNTTNRRKFYERNARLNKYLFLAQVVYLAKYDKCLFTDDFKAFVNGPVIEDIMSSYQRIIGDKNNGIPKEVKEFLDKIYLSLENATYEELIEITHEDPEWIRLKDNTWNAPIMNIENNKEEYKKRYKGLIEALKL